MLFEPLETFDDPEGTTWEIRALPTDDVKKALLFIEYTQLMEKEKVTQKKARAKPKGKGKSKEAEPVIKPEGNLQNPILFEEIVPLADEMINISVRLPESPEDEEDPKIFPMKWRGIKSKLELSAKIIKATTDIDMDFDINFQKPKEEKPLKKS